MPNSALIVADRIEKRFNREVALRETSFTIEKGEFVSIVGASGCGKSTILRLVAGLQELSGGRLCVAGSDPRQLEQATNPIALVFQEANLLPWRTAAANVALPLELKKLPGNESESRVSASLKKVGLEVQDGDKLPRMLSGGMRMRVSLARALVTEPAIMLMDEPFSALDDILRSQLNEDLLDLWMENKWTTLFVTHNVIEAVFLSQRVMVMSKRPGAIVEEIRVPLPYPRRFDLRNTPEFNRIVASVSNSLRKQVDHEQYGEVVRS